MVLSPVVSVVALAEGVGDRRQIEGDVMIVGGATAPATTLGLATLFVVGDVQIKPVWNRCRGVLLVRILAGEW